MKNKISFYIISLFFITITLFGSYKLISILYEYKIGNETYDTLKEYSNSNVISINNENKILWPTVDFKSLKKINTDIIGWIYIEDLNISYPVVQGNDNDYYLKHMADGNYNKSGSIFLDYRNKSDLNNHHTIIYGHNFQNGTMFSNLEEYKSQEYYNNNPYYLLIIEDKKYKVEIISSYVTDINDKSWDIEFKNEEEFSDWIDYTIDASIIKTNIKPTTKDRFITLSTCSYESNDSRYVLVGILIEE